MKYIHIALDEVCSKIANNKEMTDEQKELFINKISEVQFELDNIEEE